MGNEINRTIQDNINQQSIRAYQSIIQGKTKYLNTYHRTIIQVPSTQQHINSYKLNQQQQPKTQKHTVSLQEAFLLPTRIQYIGSNDSSSKTKGKAVLQFQDQLISLAKSKDIHRINNIPYTATQLWNILFTLVEITINYSSLPVNLQLKNIFTDLQAKTVKILRSSSSISTSTVTNQAYTYYDSDKLRLIQRKATIPGYIEKQNMDFNLGMILCQLMLLQECSSIYQRNESNSKTINQQNHDNFMIKIMVLPYYPIKLKIMIIGLMNLSPKYRFSIQETYDFLKESKEKIKLFRDVHFSRTKMYNIFGKKMQFIDALIYWIKQENREDIYRQGLPLSSANHEPQEIENILARKNYGNQCNNNNMNQQNLGLSQSFLFSLTHKTKTNSSLALSKSQFDHFAEKEIKPSQTQSQKKISQIKIQEEKSFSNSEAEFQLIKSPSKRQSETNLMKKEYEKDSSNKSLEVKSSFKVYENKEAHYLDGMSMKEQSNAQKQSLENKKLPINPTYSINTQPFKKQQRAQPKEQPFIGIMPSDKESVQQMSTSKKENAFSGKFNSFIANTPSSPEEPSSFSIKKIQSRTYYEPTYMSGRQSQIKTNNKSGGKGLESKHSIIDDIDSVRFISTEKDLNSKLINSEQSNLIKNKSEQEKISLQLTGSSKRKLQYLQTFSKYPVELIQKLYLPIYLPPTHTLRENSKEKIKKIDQMMKISRASYPQGISTPPRTEKMFAAKASSPDSNK